MYEVGLIGTGALGSKVAGHLVDGLVPGARLSSVYNRTPKRARAVVSSLDSEADVNIASDPVEVAEQVDVVVETASQAVVAESAVDILSTGADLVALSVGAFRDPDLLDAVRTAADKNDSRVRVPSGAIACLDGVGAIRHGTVDGVSLRCYRPPEYLEPYVDDAVDVTELPDGEPIFSGTAAEAAATFPAHMNVAIALTLTVDVRPEDVTVEIFVKRTAPRSRYVVSATGEAGAVETEVRNFATDAKPEQSALTVFSAVETLRRLTDPVVVGT